MTPAGELSKRAASNFRTIGTAGTKTAAGRPSLFRFNRVFADTRDPVNPQTFEDVASQALANDRSGRALMDQLGAGQLLNPVMTPQFDRSVRSIDR